MAKAKAVKGTPGATNKVAYSRIQFLNDAAILLAKSQHEHLPSAPTTHTSDIVQEESHDVPARHSVQLLSRRLACDLRSVSRKTQIRLSPDIKHSICKACNTVLLEGSTCVTKLENNSKGGKKPWADVKVQMCNTCGLAKRFPTGAKKQKRRPHRELSDVAMTDATLAGD